MATVSVTTIIETTQGGEIVRYSDKRSATVGSRKYDALATISDDGGSEVLWASGTHLPQWIGVFVDPNDEYEDGDAAAQLTIEIKNTGGATTALRVRRETPLILGAGDIGVDIDNLDEVIDSITAKNENAAAAGDVEVRIIVFSLGTPA